MPLSVELDTLSFWAEAGGQIPLAEMHRKIKALHAEARKQEQSSELDAPPG
jgi:hypothetical protein